MANFADLRGHEVYVIEPTPPTTDDLRPPGGAELI